MAGATPNHVLRFGAFELDSSVGELRSRGIRLPVQGQPLQVLTILLENPGRVVTREELRHQIWAVDTFVDFDHALNNSIASLREALGDSAAKPRYIETLRRRGYRWVGPAQAPSTAFFPDRELAEPSNGSSFAQSPSAVPTRSKRLGVAFAVAILVLAGSIPAASILIRRSRKANAPSRVRSIAVLPLENLSPDPADEYFSDGMTDELVTKLAAVPDLRIISRTSAMRFKGARVPVADIARALQVDAIVEGSVVHSADRVRVNVQLIQAATDGHLWARSYEDAFTDIVRLQTRIASAIVEEIEITVASSDRGRLTTARAVNPRAYEMYLKGRYHWNKRTEPELRLALKFFEQSVEAAPQNA